MASYIVASSQVFSGSADADSIWLQSGGAISTVYGLAGADTISVDGVNDGDNVGPVLRGADGADRFNIQSGTFSAGGSKIYGGQGADTIILSGASTIASLNTNEGNDLVQGSGAYTLSAATFSTGADTLDLASGAIVGSIGMGNGHDLFSGNSVNVTSASTLKLGDGRDTITLVAMGAQSNASSITIQGDTSTNYAADVITVSVTGDITGLVIKGQGGGDTITLSGGTQSSLIQGNGGADSISITQSYSGQDVVIAGGAGADTINVTEALPAMSGEIFGGKDADSIFIAQHAGLGVNATNMSIYGGAGADTITVSGAATMASGELATLAYSSLTDSTLGTVDLFQVVSGTTSGTNGSVSGSTSIDVEFGGNVILSAITTGFATVRAGNATSFTTIAANGVATWEGDLSGQVSSLTAAVEQIDKTVISEDHAALFTTGGGTEYLFIQGGTTGDTSDDLVLQFGGVSASTLTDAGSAVQVNFSGVAS